MVDYVSSSRPFARRRERADVGSALRRLDWVLLGGVVACVLYGLWAIEGITRADVPDDPTYYVTRQAIFAALGAVVFVAALLVDPAVYRRYKTALYLGTCGAMVFILIAGAAARGSKRWIDIGFFQLQPSEFGKLLFVLAIAAFLADRGKRVVETRTIVTALALASVPIVLVFLQPDIGTALVYGAALVAVLFVAGARWWQLGTFAAATALLAICVLWLLPASGIQLLRPYQLERLTAFAHPENDPQDASWNTIQSMNAVGSGGTRGVGTHADSQTTLNYLPEHHTDFAFASLAEQRGFLGASVLLLLYLLIVWRGLKVITVARDSYSAIVAGGITVALLFQIFVNVGMTIGIAPVTGIPLPFVSVGGSSLIANLAAMGVLQAIHVRGGTGRRSRRLGL